MISQDGIEIRLHNLRRSSRSPRRQSRLTQWTCGSWCSCSRPFFASTSAKFRAWSVSPPRASVFLVVSQPRRFVAQNDKEIEVLGCLLGVRSEFARNLEFAQNLLGIRSENSPDQPCTELSKHSFQLFQSSGRVHAKGGVLCETTCFCLVSTFCKTLPSKNPSKSLVFTENPYRRQSKNPSKKHVLLE